MGMQVRNIYQRVNQVQLEVESVQKESKKVNGQYTFVSHDAVTKLLHMPIAKAGIVMIPNVDEIIDMGNKVRAKMTLTFVNIDNPEDRYSVSCFGDGIDNQDKGIGKAVSYAVKGGMLKAFFLDAGDDVERDSIEYQPAKKPSKLNDSGDEREITAKELEELTAICDSDDEKLVAYLSWAGCNMDKDDCILFKHYKKIVKAYESKKQKIEPLVQEKAI